MEVIKSRYAQPIRWAVDSVEKEGCYVVNDFKILKPKNPKEIQASPCFFMIITFDFNL